MIGLGSDKNENLARAKQLMNSRSAFDFSYGTSFSQEFLYLEHLYYPPGGRNTSMLRLKLNKFKLQSFQGFGKKDESCIGQIYAGAVT